MTESTEEARGQAVMGALAVAVVLGVVWLAVSSFFPDSSSGRAQAGAPASEATTPPSDPPSDPPSEATPPPSDPPTHPRAMPYPSIQEACDAATQDGPVERVPRAAATADADWVTAQVDLGRDVRAVGVGSCLSSPVVVVGVGDTGARLPSTPPRGTPILVYFQRPLYAF